MCLHTVCVAVGHLSVDSFDYSQNFVIYKIKARLRILETPILIIAWKTLGDMLGIKLLNRNNRCYDGSFLKNRSIWLNEDLFGRIKIGIILKSASSGKYT